MEQDGTILEDLLVQNVTSRRKLLPIWMKVFIWLFMILGAITPLLVLTDLKGVHSKISAYGLETTQPLSTTGLIIYLIFLIKGVAAFGLWTEKDWAILIAKVDAILGITACVFIQWVLPFINSKYQGGMPLEIAFLIPYLMKVIKIQPLWMRADVANT
jgi:hypothetical protein